MEKETVAVAGLGNLLLTDDGIGVRLVRSLQKLTLPDNLVLYEIGNSVFYLYTLAARHKKLLLVDAVYGGGKPGTGYLFSSEEIRKLQREQHTDGHASFYSLHDFSAMDLPGPVQDSPVCQRLFGVEPAIIDYGTVLSPLLDRLLPSLTASLLREALNMAAGR